MSELLVPRSRIPKLVAMCTKCGGATRTLMSQAYADGYHRRHACKDTSCRYTFYSLSPYNGKEAQVSPLPFAARPLSEAEESQRVQWWAEEMELSRATMTLADRLSALPLKVTQTIERMAMAIAKPKEARTHIDNFLVDMVLTIENELESFDKKGNT